jgi:hypothetical protein
VAKEYKIGVFGAVIQTNIPQKKNLLTKIIKVM